MLSLSLPPFTVATLQVLSLLCATGVCCGGYTPPTKYLIVSNARNGSIGYVRLNRDGNLSEATTLIDKDLVHPQGIAVDQKRQLLLIADSELRKVVSYGLLVHEDGTLGVDEQTPVAEEVASRWVAVDGPGNVYFTDEENSKVLKISAAQVLDGDTKPRPVFADPKGDGAGSILAPGGVATDNFHIFWTNKEQGKEVGTVMKALEGPPLSNTTGAALNSQSLAKNVPKAYGLCLAMGNIYYTDTEKHVYAVTAKGDGKVVKVTSELSNPRGCAWDGESTVYIADRSADGVFSLPAPSMSLAEAKATKVARFEGAFGVAVFSSARSRLAGSMLLPLVLACALAAAAAGQLGAAV